MTDWLDPKSAAGNPTNETRCTRSPKRNQKRPAQPLSGKSEPLSGSAQGTDCLLRHHKDREARPPAQFCGDIPQTSRTTDKTAKAAFTRIGAETTADGSQGKAPSPASFSVFSDLIIRSRRWHSASGSSLSSVSTGSAGFHSNGLTSDRMAGRAGTGPEGRAVQMTAAGRRRCAGASSDGERNEAGRRLPCGLAPIPANTAWRRLVVRAPPAVLRDAARSGLLPLLPLRA